MCMRLKFSPVLIKYAYIFFQLINIASYTFTDRESKLKISQKYLNEMTYYYSSYI